MSCKQNVSPPGKHSDRNVTQNLDSLYDYITSRLPEIAVPPETVVPTARVVSYS